MVSKALIALAVVCIMAGCTTVPKGSFCSIASPIRLSPQAIDALSDAEVAAILAHNRKLQKLCGIGP